MNDRSVCLALKNWNCFLEKGGLPQVVLVQESEEHAGGQSCAVVAGSGLPAINGTPHVARLGVPQDYASGLIRGRVVHDDQFEIAACLGQYALDGLVQVS
jgi:hypothetical protein